MKIHRRLGRITFGVAAGLTLLLGTEVLHAMLGERLPVQDPYMLDGRFGGAGDALQMVWVGDSIAAGVGASEAAAALPRLVADGAGRPIDLRVLAVSGDRVAGAIADQIPLVERLQPRPDVVVVEIGANDVIHLTGRAAFRRDYDRLLTRVVATGAPHVIALGLPAFGSTPRFLQPLRAIVAWRSRRLDTEVRRVAARHRVRYVDIAAETEPGFAADPDGTHAADRFHPNDAGYRLWARAILPVLREIQG